MSSFSKTNTTRTPFGKNEFLRSTEGVLTESYTLAKDSMPTVTIDGETQKVLQPGTILASITSGPDAGKVGPFQGVGVREVNTATKTGTWSGGTYTVTAVLLGVTYTTAAVAYNATAATVEAALETAGVPTNAIKVTGGPLSTTPLVFTHHSAAGGNMTNIAIDAALVTGSTPAVGIVETTAGTAGATDGRGDTDNIVGINVTFLPWQLLERDVEVAAAYACVAKQAWCIEYSAAGAAAALGDTTRDAILALTTLNILFK